MSDPRAVLSLVVVAGALVLAVTRSVIDRQRRDYAFLLVPLLLAFAIWVPREIRDFALPALCGAILLLESVGAAAIVAGVTFALGVVLPGGATVPVLLVFALVGYLAGKDAWAHLVRMRAAGRITPGERPAGDVEIGGRAFGTQTLALPASESTCIAWWVETSGVQKRASAAPIGIRTEVGPAVVYPGDVEPSLTDARVSFWTGAAAQPIVAALEIEPTPAELDDEPSVWVRWLEDGDEVYVVGRPVWETAPPGVADTYRDSPALPTFRAEPGRKGFIADSSEDAVRRASLWSLWQWAVWAAVCSAIAITQLAAE